MNLTWTTNRATNSTTHSTPNRTPNSVRNAAAVLVGIAVLAACGTESGSGSVGAGSTPRSSATPKTPKTPKASETPDIGDIRWVPLKVSVDGKDFAFPTGDAARLRDAGVTFEPGAADPDGGGLSGGSVGCNSFGADVEIEGDTVKVTDLAMTAVGCEKAVGEFEGKFIDVFTGTLKAAVEDRDGTKILTLTRNNGDSITLREGATETGPALKGTRWTIDTLLSGKGDDASAASLPDDSEAYLILTKDNRISGGLGCNTFKAEATVKDGTKGGTIELGPLATTRMVCTDTAAETERELTEILTGKLSYQRERDVLTLTAASGKGLAAHAK